MFCLQTICQCDDVVFNHLSHEHVSALCKNNTNCVGQWRCCYFFSLFSRFRSSLIAWKLRKMHDTWKTMPTMWSIQDKKNKKLLGQSIDSQIFRQSHNRISCKQCIRCQKYCRFIRSQSHKVLSFSSMLHSLYLTFFFSHFSSSCFLLISISIVNKIQYISLLIIYVYE